MSQTILPDGGYAPPRSAQTLSLLCMPFGGGTVAAYKPLSKSLSAAVRWNGFEYPGHGARWGQPMPTTLAALADVVIDEAGAWLQEPFALFGHSLGALVAFEIARKLKDQHQPLPACLVISGARAPHLPPLAQPIHALPDESFLNAVIEYGGIPDAVLADSDLVRLMLPLVRHDFRIFETYHFENSGSLPVEFVALGGLNDMKAPVSDVLQWTRHTSMKLQTTFFNGGHFFLLDQPKAVADSIAACLTSITMKTAGVRHR